MTDLFLVPQPEDSRPEAAPAPDWMARQEALDVRRSWIVEAPAGSGKTALLIQRFLKLLADEHVEQPEQVLAITFTVKATAEMRERVTKQLRDAAGPDLSKNAFDRETRMLAQAVLARDRLMGWQLLDHPRRLNMRTIDSVCGEIAHSLPVLSGGGSGLAPVDDPTSLYEEAAQRTWMQLGGPDKALDDALRTLLLHRDGNLHQCEQLLAGILELRNQWGEFVPLSGPGLSDTQLDETVFPRLQYILKQVVRAGLTELRVAFPDSVLNELADLAGEMGHSPGYKGARSPIECCAGLHTPPGVDESDTERWRALIHLLKTKDPTWRASTSRNFIGFEIEKPHAKRLTQILEQLRGDDDLLRTMHRVTLLPAAQYPEEQWLVAKALFRVLSRALAELQIVFAERGECDFAEHGLLACAALEHAAATDDLAAALGMRFQHLLVDEMQDTSTSQYRLLELLTQGWDGHSQTVFLVGDPKQSIYLFRQARVERFMRTMLTGELGTLPLGHLQLTANFRSQGNLIDDFNDMFSLLFPARATRARQEEVPYVRAAPVRTATVTPSLQWHPTVLPGALPAAEAHSVKRHQMKRDAEEIRSIVERWRARPHPSGPEAQWTIAILVRSRNVLADIIAEFRGNNGRQSIPYRAKDIEALGERQEVLDLFALTRALLHPADRTAWLGVLRAPWCGLGLAELHLLTGGDDPEFAKRSMVDVIAERGDLLSEESCERLRRLWPVLRSGMDRLQNLSLAQCVERTWRSLGGDACLSPAEMDNARRYLHLLDEMEAQANGVDLAALERRMRKLSAETRHIPGAVELLTIHGAKGLEWDVVIVPSMERPPRQEKGRLLTWDEFDAEDDTTHVILAPIAGRGESSKGLNDWIRSAHRNREAAELKRLLYVVCTRAREELHLFAAPTATAKGNLNPRTGSLLQAAWPAAHQHFPAAICPSETSLEDNTELSLAAAAVPSFEARTTLRLPLKFDPRSRFSTVRPLKGGGPAEPSNGAHFLRPHGTFETRAFGNAIHTFLELLAGLTAQGVANDDLLEQVAGWKSRITAVLRADGVPAHLLEQRSQHAQTALLNTLRDATGRWLLTAQTEASSEFALTTWHEGRMSVRLDRMFRAGSEPLAAGQQCLWIVDYKTTTHGDKGMEQFLLDERAAYAEQLETYARIMLSRSQAADIRVALYFPLLARLVWWVPAI